MPETARPPRHRLRRCSRAPGCRSVAPWTREPDEQGRRPRDELARADHSIAFRDPSRRAARRSANARSAVASASTPGVFVTTTPRVRARRRGPRCRRRRRRWPRAAEARRAREERGVDSIGEERDDRVERLRVRREENAGERTLRGTPSPKPSRPRPLAHPPRAAGRHRRGEGRAARRRARPRRARPAHSPLDSNVDQHDQVSPSNAAGSRPRSARESGRRCRPPSRAGCRARCASSRRRSRPPPSRAPRGPRSRSENRRGGRAPRRRSPDEGASGAVSTSNACDRIQIRWRLNSSLFQLVRSS